MTLSAAIMAHPRRADMVKDLRRRLGGSVPVVWDEHNDRHDTGIRSLLAFDPAASHHLVIQDDALPCRHLLASIERALPYVPEGHPASFYIGRVKPFRAAVNAAVASAEGASWLRFPGPWWGPAIVVPTAVIGDLAAWWTRPSTRRIQNYDRRVSTWFTRQGIDCFYSWPSLVDHRGHESLVSGHTAVRSAHRALSPHQSGLRVDWSGPVVGLPNAVKHDKQRQRAARLAGVGR